MCDLVVEKRGVINAKRSQPSLMLQAFQRLWMWRAMALQRRDLARLDGRLLRDIGIHHEDAVREARRPFWDVE